jgi:aminoglycoside phosphotransferase (APT) family kinase protein
MQLRSSAICLTLAAMAMHADELPIDAAVARDLIGAQFPQWRGLHVRRVTSSGTDNAIPGCGPRSGNCPARPPT